MGDQNIKKFSNKKSRQNFTRNLLDDLEALEQMLQNGQIESGIIRIGAEQEFCLVNEYWRPAENALEILESIDHENFTTELAKYNLEINLDPHELTGNAFTKVENQLRSLLKIAHNAAEKHQSHILLTGILPTISTQELDLDYMTPMPRYFALNDMMKKLRGSDFHFHVSGVHELTVKHANVMFEACNTSFQMHLQVDSDDFTSSYNWAQAISGPVLGMCVNSPLLLGRELWAETRIALFQQSIDTRAVTKALKNQPARVAFGDEWIDGTIVDIFKKEIARHKIILSKDIEENALDVLEQGGTPKLQAANLFNGTIYRLYRRCYCVGNGDAHIRIENRYIPSGPSILDEMANFAFWVGLMKGRPTECDVLQDKMDFKDVKSNFIKAARNGSESVMKWMGKEVNLRTLVANELLPLARAGLVHMNIDENDITRLLGVIESRVNSHTPAQWLTNNYRKFGTKLGRDGVLVALTKSIYEHQQKDEPIHQWPSDATMVELNYSNMRVEHVMSTQLITAYEEDTAELTLRIMEWKNIHHMPIVDGNENLVGLLTWNHLRQFKKERLSEGEHHVSEIMVQQVFTAKTSMRIEDAILLMKENEIGCLPVIQKKHLVGIITMEDLERYNNA